MSKRKPRPDYNQSLVYTLEVVTKNRKGQVFKHNRPMIKLSDPLGNFIQWVNDEQAAMLEQKFQGQVEWR